MFCCVNALTNLFRRCGWLAARSRSPCFCPGFHALPDLGLNPTIRWLIPCYTPNHFGQVLLPRSERIGFGMIVSIPSSITQFLHQPCRSIPKVSRNGLGGILSRGLDRLPPRLVDPV